MQSPPVILTREQVRRVDQIAIQDFCVPSIVLMENAALGAVKAIRDAQSPLDNVLILCGGGNNGGDGLAIARHLHNVGSKVTVGLCTDPENYKGDALINWNIIQAMELSVVSINSDSLEEHVGGGNAVKPSLIIDAIFGTGLTVAPREPFPQIVETLENSMIPIVAIDLPSGLDCDTGMPLGERAIRATLTATFVGWKKGFTAPAAATYTGDVRVVEIGCPAEAVKRAMSPRLA